MKYEIPESIEELFENRERSYSIIDHEESNPMDNIQSMNFFLESVGVTEENIELNDGTLVFLKHKDYPYQIQVNSYGLGDFFSHGYDVSIYQNN